MSKQKPAVKVRIKMQGNSPVNDRPDVVYVYQWRRIIAVAVIVTLLAFVGLRHFFWSHQSSDTAQTAQTENIPSAEHSALATTDTKTAAPASARIVATTSDPAISLSPQHTQSPTASNNTPASTSPSAKQPTSEKSTPNQRTVRVKSLEPKQALSNRPALSNIETALHSSKIKRFVLSQSIKNKEPLGNIADVVVDTSGMVTLYAFSQIVGMGGETVYYVWNLNGKQIAKVKVAVRSGNWRSYSRKYLNSKMQGDWQVRLQTAKGDVLAEARFRY